MAKSDELAAEYATELIPVYPATKDVSTWDIEKCVRIVLDTLGEVEDPLPGALRERHGLIGLSDALRGIHRPADEAEMRRAEKRLKWDEAFVLQSVLAQRRRAAAALPATARPAGAGGLAGAFDARLPFTLTAGQQEVGADIAADLARDHPMHRLLQGEVGSGKTVIAVRAMLQVIDAGGQAALLAPTEVLAQQHYRSVSDLLGPLGEAGRLGSAEEATRVALLTGSQPAAAPPGGAARRGVGRGRDRDRHPRAARRAGAVRRPRPGGDRRTAPVRRGAARRAARKAQGARPHVLVMTATPIPRTVAMTVYGDLDVSTLAELPRGRSPIATHVVPAAEKPRYLERAWERVAEEAEKGRQAYVVCPRIGEDDGAPSSGESGGPASSGPGDADAALGGADDDGSPGRPPLAVLDVAPALAQGPLAGLRLRVMHGRLPTDDKDAAMRAFTDGSADVLVSTTVVEVGVDVPNATVMVIMDADRFGVSQLHQLRGRVGRGTAPGLCLLVTEAPEGSKARQRLADVQGD